jgi:hypothetical protein
MDAINEPEESLTCPKCGGFLQYFKNIMMCRDCDYVIRVFPVQRSNMLPEFIVVHNVDGKKTVIQNDEERDARDVMKEIVISHQDGKVVSSADAIDSWDVAIYKKVN